MEPERTKATMQVVAFEECGGPEVLHPAEVDEPAAEPEQVRIRIAASGTSRRADGKLVLTVD